MGTSKMRVTDLERENLEAHVDLSAERYDYMEERMSDLEDSVEKLQKSMDQMNKDYTKMIISTAFAIIAGLSSVIFTLMTK